MKTELIWRDTITDKPVECRTKLLYIPEHDMSITGDRVGNLYYTPLGTFAESRVQYWAELPRLRGENK